MTEILHFAIPRHTVIIHDYFDLHCFVSVKDYRRIYGKQKAQLLPGERCDSLHFTTVASPCAFRRERGAFGENITAITGKGLFQMLIWNALANKTKVFDDADVKLFFEGQDRRAAESFISDVAPLIARADMYETLPDSEARFRAAQEREINGRWWQQAGLIDPAEVLPDPKPLPANGKYSFLERVAHNKQSGLLAQEMAARMRGEN